MLKWERVFKKCHSTILGGNSSLPINLLQCSSDISEPKYTRNTRQPNTRIRVCIYANTRIQCMHVCLISMYELTYFSSFVNRSLFLATEQKRVSIILNICIQYMHVCLQTRLGKMLAETVETNILQLISLTGN